MICWDLRHLTECERWDVTKKLFYEDGYLQEFTARVLSCSAEGNHFVVVLDRTAFFPEGGGQYGDTGWLDDVHVMDVQEKEDVIYHITDKMLEIDREVTGKLDWGERFMKMQQHTGEHIVSGIVHGRFGYNNVGFHLGSEDCTMDFDGEITRKQLKEIEWEANQAAVSNLEVLISYPSKEILNTMQYRSKIEIAGQVRIVTIPGYDVCACCAPHVRRTGEIGLIKLTNVQHYKRGVRVTMLCGFRALSDYSAKESRARAISMSLCAKEGEIDEAVEHLKAERERLKAEVLQQHRALLEARLSTLQEGAEGICLFEAGLDGEDMKYLMNLVLERGKKRCAVISGDGSGGFRYVVGSKTENMRPVAKWLNERFQGRGGGKSEMVQGACKSPINQKELRTFIETCPE